MPENPTVSQVTQLGLEVTEGTQVAATKRVVGLSVDMEPQGNVDTFRPDGYFFDTVAIPGKEWGQGKLKAAACYNALAYALDSILMKTTPTGGGTAKTRTYAPSSTLMPPIQTYSVEHGTVYQARTMANSFVNELNLEFKRESIKVDGTVMGKIIQENTLANPVYLSTNQTYTVTLGSPSAGNFTLTFNAQTTAPITYNATASAVQTALQALSTIGAGNAIVSGTVGNYTVTFVGTLGQTAQTLTGNGVGLTGGTFAATAGTAGAAPTEVPAVPIVPKTIDVFVDLTAAGLGTTQMNRGYNVGIKLGNRNLPVWALKSSATSWDGRAPGVPSSALSLTLGCDTQGTNFLTQLRAGQPIFFRVQATGPLISGGGNCSLVWDSCMLINKPHAYSDESGVYAVKLEGVFSHDSTWGKALNVVLVNALAAL
jgi:hypothetical protein